MVIDGNRILSVGASSSATTPRGQVVDAKGMYVIPGLWDMHTHAYFGWPADFGDTYVLPLFIANGVTGIRDMGSDLDAVLRARGEVAAHRLVGPRMVVSGPMLDGPQVAFNASIAIKTADDGLKAVGMLKSKGVDFIKIQSGVPRDAYFAIAAEAKKLGIQFDGHVPDAIRASEAVAAGQRTFEHLIGIFEASTPNEDTFLKTQVRRGEGFRRQQEPRRVSRHSTTRRERRPSSSFWRRTTCGSARRCSGNVVSGSSMSSTSRRIPTSRTRRAAGSRRSIHRCARPFSRAMDTDPLGVRRRFVDHELDIVRKLHAAGVPFLAGTDTPAGVDVTPGISLHLELQRFVAAGFTPLEALQTATINPARFLSKLADYGSVETGRVADLVILRANPLDDIANTRKIGGVVADGRYWSQADIERFASASSGSRLDADYVASANTSLDRR